MGWDHKKDGHFIMSEFLGSHKTFFLLVLILIIGSYIVVTAIATVTRILRMIRNDQIPPNETIKRVVSQGLLQLVFLFIAIPMEIIAIYYLMMD
jgi:uncharacterized membrane protein YidH (DUF202 family)